MSWKKKTLPWPKRYVIITMNLNFLVGFIFIGVVCGGRLEFFRNTEKVFKDFAKEAREPLRYVECKNWRFFFVLRILRETDFSDFTVTKILEASQNDSFWNSRIATLNWMNSRKIWMTAKFLKFHTVFI